MYSGLFMYNNILTVNFIVIVLHLNDRASLFAESVQYNAIYVIAKNF